MRAIISKEHTKATELLQLLPLTILTITYSLHQPVQYKQYKLTSSPFLYSSFNVWLGIKITLYNLAHVHVTKIHFF